MIRLLAIGAATVCLAACARVDRSDLPPDWPREWAGRSLYSSPGAFIYAPTKEAANDAGRLARRVADEAVDETGRAPAKGLLIVTDGAGLDALIDPSSAHAAALDNVSPERTRAAIEDADDLTPDQRRVAANTVQAVLSLAAIPLVGDEKSAVLALPEPVRRDAPYLVLVPTTAATERGVRETLDTAMTGQKLSFAQRLVASPLLGWARGRMVDALVESHEAALLEAIARGDPDLSPAERRRLRARSAAKLDRVGSDAEVPEELLPPH